MSSPRAVSGSSAAPALSFPSTVALTPWPSWLAAGPTGHGTPHVTEPLASHLDSRHFHLSLVEVADARALPREGFQGAVREAYRSIDQQIAGSQWPHAVRYWAFIPGIDDLVAPGLDRYMVFNEGRFDAFAARAGRAADLARVSPTASGIGGESAHLVIACLSSAVPGRPFENPRQIAAYRYSTRFGPRPPCFARATSVPGLGGRSVLLVGGTASITGEDSRHLDNLDRQVDETLLNLAAVAAAAEGVAHSPADLPARLSQYLSLRVYLPRRTDPAAVAARLAGVLPAEVGVEWRRAQLCRPELLVEIEGVAVLSSTAS